MRFRGTFLVLPLSVLCFAPLCQAAAKKGGKATTTATPECKKLERQYNAKAPRIKTASCYLGSIIEGSASGLTGDPTVNPVGICESKLAACLLEKPDPFDKKSCKAPKQVALPEGIVCKPTKAASESCSTEVSKRTAAALDAYGTTFTCAKATLTPTQIFKEEPLLTATFGAFEAPKCAALLKQCPPLQAALDAFKEGFNGDSGNGELPGGTDGGKTDIYPVQPGTYSGTIEVDANTCPGSLRISNSPLKAQSQLATVSVAPGNYHLDFTDRDIAQNLESYSGPSYTYLTGDPDRGERSEFFAIGVDTSAVCPDGSSPSRQSNVALYGSEPGAGRLVIFHNYTCPNEDSSGQLPSCTTTFVGRLVRR